MTTLVKIGVTTAVVAVAVAVVPALRGPYNRFKNEANEKLNDEYVVDNYKAEYVKLNEKKVSVTKSREKFAVERAVVQKKLVAAENKLRAAKNKLVAVGTSDLKAFNTAKSAYESFKLERDNLIALESVYSNAVVKLDTSLALIEDNMRKAKTNVDMLSSKKILVDSIKSVNETISNLQGTGDSGMSIAVEKLDETALRESIKLEALADVNAAGTAMSEAEAKAYLETVK